MPTYQYACTTTDCGNEFELVQSFTDPAARACPVCAGPVRKVFSAVGVVFKGSGFYRNDSRDAKSASDRAKKGTPGGGDAAGSGASKEKSTAGDSASSTAAAGKSASGDSGKSTSAPSAPSTSGSSSKAAASA